VGTSAHGREGRQRRGYGVIAGTAVVLTVVAAAVVWMDRRSATPQARSPQPSATTQSQAPRVARVTYEVSGKGRVDIQYTDPARVESTTLTDQRLPWRVDLGPHAVSFVQITARRRVSNSGHFDGDDEHPVRALVDGVEVCNGTDAGGYLQSTCSELVPPALSSG
jgi:hypothetical protein